jgi:hypothetical protein
MNKNAIARQLMAPIRLHRRTRAARARCQRPRNALKSPVWETLESRFCPSSNVADAFGQVPLGFERNQGQAASAIDYLSHGPGFSLDLEGGQAALSLDTGQTLRMSVVGSAGLTAPVASDLLPGVVNYLTGSNPAGWKTDVPRYGVVSYPAVLPGVALAFHGSTARQLEYDITVAPGVDPATIRLRFDGAGGMQIASDGSLLISIGGTQVQEAAPIVYQMAGGNRIAVTGHYVLYGTNQVGFSVGAFNAALPLVIDPVLVYSTFLGGSQADIINDVAVDDQGNAYVVGTTFSSDLPGPPNLFTTNVNNNVFVAKLDPSGQNLLYLTLLGGSILNNNQGTGTEGHGIAVDSQGDAYVTGTTTASDFPLFNPLPPNDYWTPASIDPITNVPALNQAFVAKLTDNGDGFFYSTYLGGIDQNEGNAIAVDGKGDAYVVGDTNSYNRSGFSRSTGFPTVAAVQTQLGSEIGHANPPASGIEATDAFAARLHFSQPANGPVTLSLVYSTYLGGTGDDVANAVAVDAKGAAYITGTTASFTNAVNPQVPFPTTLGAYQQSNHSAEDDPNLHLGSNTVGTFDAFVTKIDPTGTLNYSTYFGGGDNDYGFGIAVDAQGRAYVAGETFSSNAPTDGEQPLFRFAGVFQPFQANLSGNQLPQNRIADAYLAIFDPPGASLLYATYFGGTGLDFASRVALDPSGEVVIDGDTQSPDLTPIGAVQPILKGGTDAFVARFRMQDSTTGSGLSLTPDLVTYLGGSNDDGANGLAVDNSGAIIVVGGTFSANFPLQLPYQPNYGGAPTTGNLIGSGDGFITKLPGNQVSLVGIPINATRGLMFTGAVATFTQPDPARFMNEFVPTIFWGDGTHSLGSFIASGDITAPMSVIGSHTYLTPGSYVVTVVVHDNVRGTDITEDVNVSHLAGNQEEGNIAVDPFDSTRLFAASNTDGGGLFGAYSTDGGKTWTGRRMADGNDGLLTAHSDPQLAWDSLGNLFLTYVQAGDLAVVVAVSRDGGRSFTQAAVLAGPGGGKVDQPSIAVGPAGPGDASQGSVWISFADVANALIAASGAQTANNAAPLNFSKPVDLPESDTLGIGDPNFGGVAVGPKGEVLVTWQDNAVDHESLQPSTGSDIFVSLDPDGLGPAPFAPPNPNESNPARKLVTSTNVGGSNRFPDTTPSRGVDAEANLAWDLSRNRVYLVYTDRASPTATATTIRLRFSDDDGQSWSDPVTVDHANFLQGALILPSVAVDPGTGDVAVAWYDPGADPAGVKAQFDVAVSADGGKTFSIEQPVGLGFSNATDPNIDVTHTNNNNGFGDYTGITFLNGVIHPIWADNSSTPLPMNPDRPRFDMATATVGEARVKDAPAQVVGIPINAREGAEFDGTVAFIENADPNITSDKYEASIAWGDGQSSRGEVSSVGTNGLLAIKGSNTYHEAGRYPIVVTLHDTVSNTDSTSATDVSAIAGHDAGGAIAADPGKPGVLFAASDHEGVGLFAAISVDAGATWSPVDPINKLIADPADPNQDLPGASGGVAVAFDAFGNLYLAYENTNQSAVVVLVSTDDGMTFRKTPLGNFPAAKAGRPVIATSLSNVPGQGGASVWVVFPDLGGPGMYAASAIATDPGQVSAFGAPELIPATLGVSSVGGVAITDKGAVLVSYASELALGGTAIETSLDPDGVGPMGFDQPVVVDQFTDAAAGSVVALGATPYNPAPVIDFDYYGLERGKTYLVYGRPTPDGQHVEIVARTSLDSGHTYSSASVVSDPSSDSFGQALAIDINTGQLAVSWYGTASDDTGKTTLVFVATARNNGTFNPPNAVDVGRTDATDANLTTYAQSVGYGGPTSLAFREGLLTPLWADNSASLPGNPDRPQFDQAAAIVGIAQVSDVNLDPVGKLNIPAVQGVPFEGELATFTDANPFAMADDFVVTLDWNDGTKDTVVPTANNNDGMFHILGNHTYKTLGPQQVNITIDDQPGGAQTQLIATFNVTAPLSFEPALLKEYKDRPFQAELGDFTVADPNATTDPMGYSATVDWGDGTTSHATVGRGVDVFLVLSQPKTLTTLGFQPAKVTITELANGASATFPLTLNIVEQLNASGTGITSIAGEPFDGVVANVSDADQSDTDAQLKASIDWGDGTSGDGEVVAFLVGKFVVKGSHTYAKAGKFNIQVTIVHDEGPSAATTSDMDVLAPLFTGGTLDVPGTGFQGLPEQSSASFTYDGPPAPPGSFHATVDWGDGSAPDMPTPSVMGGTVSTDATHTYAQPGDYTVTETILGPSGSTDTTQASESVADNISGEVEADSTGLVQNPQTQLFDGSVTLTNVSAGDVSGPVLDVVLAGLPADVSVVGASGQTPNGDPFLSYDLNQNVLGPGQSTTPIDVEFSDPNLDPFTYTTSVFADPPSWYEQAIAGADGAPASDPAPPFGGLFEGFQPSANGVGFTAQVPGGELGLSPGGGLQLADQSQTVTLALAGANSNASPRTLDPLPGVVNVLRGNDPSAWIRDQTRYGRIVYRGVYPGIDLQYRQNTGQMEYDFVLAPFASPSQISIKQTGASAVAIDASGNLVLTTAAGSLVERAPVAYQLSAGAMRPVSAKFAIRPDGTVGFTVSGADPSQPLVIDPTLVYSSYFGGPRSDEGYAIALDPSGNTYITGDTESFSGVATTGALQSQFAGDVSDAFVAKFDPAGRLIYSTYLGGRRNDYGFAVATDAQGDAYVAGATGSDDFPTTPGAFQTHLASTVTPDDTSIGPSDAFLVKLSPDGSRLIYSTYLGGANNDMANGVAVDALGEAVVTGYTNSVDFPTKDPIEPYLHQAFQNIYPNDVFVTKFSADGSKLLYSTYLGGDGNDRGGAVALDSAGNAYITGTCVGDSINSPFPTTPDAARPTPGLAFLTKISNDGSRILYSTYLDGGGGSDLLLFKVPAGIALDSAGNIYVAGSTEAVIFPATPGAVIPKPPDLSTAGGFLTKYDPAGRIVYSTLLMGPSDQGSGSGYSAAGGVAVDGQGVAYVVGETRTSLFPTTNDAAQPHHANDNGQPDGFLAAVAPDGSSFVYSTYLGGNVDDYAMGVAIDAQGRAHVVGTTGSSDFPTTSNAAQPESGGGVSFDRFDAFLAIIQAPAAVVDLGVKATPVSAVEGIPFRATVASFADAAPGATPSDFSATINWGDGTSTTGQIVSDGAAEGHFSVVGAHVFNEDGSSPITVSVSGQSVGGSSAIRATVADAPIVLQGAPVAAFEGRAFSGRVATLYDASAFGSASDFVANIDWGDGSTSAGTVIAQSSKSGQYAVSGSHVYSDEGAYLVTIVAKDRGGSKAIAYSSLESAMSAGSDRGFYHIEIDTSSLAGRAGFVAFELNPGMTPIPEPVAASLSGFQGTVDEPTANPLSLTGVKVLNQLLVPAKFGGLISFDVDLSGGPVGRSLRTTAGSTFAVQLLSTDKHSALLSGDASGAILRIDVSPNGQSTALVFAPATAGLAPAARPVNVTDAPLSASARALHTTISEPFGGTVASFTDANPRANASDFSATVAWGDAVPVVATIRQGPGGVFYVESEHTFSHSGLQSFVVTIHDRGGASAIATGSVSVSATSGGGGTGGGTDGPRLVSILRYGFHHWPTFYVLTFDQSIDPSSASNLENFQIATSGPDHRFDTRDDRSVPLLSAAVGPTPESVTVRLKNPLNFHKRYYLSIRGTGPSPLRDLAGLPLDGAGAGVPGSDAHAWLVPDQLVTPREMRQRAQIVLPAKPTHVALLPAGPIPFLGASPIDHPAPRAELEGKGTPRA